MAFTKNDVEHAAKLLQVNLLWNEPICPGDLYLAQRNGEPVLLQCESLNIAGGWIQPTTLDYAYDAWECVKIRQ